MSQTKVPVQRRQIDCAKTTGLAGKGEYLKVSPPTNAAPTLLIVSVPASLAVPGNCEQVVAARLILVELEDGRRSGSQRQVVGRQ